MEVYTL
jgi:serine/threonine protein kinase